MITLLCILGLAAFIDLFAGVAGVIFTLAIVYLIISGLIYTIKCGKWIWILLILLILL